MLKTSLLPFLKDSKIDLLCKKNKVSAIPKELKRSQPEYKGRFEMKRPSTRQKRTINPQISLSDLNKRIITLESTYDQ